MQSQLEDIWTKYIYGSLVKDKKAKCLLARSFFPECGIRSQQLDLKELEENFSELWIHQQPSQYSRSDPVHSVLKKLRHFGCLFLETSLKNS